MLVQHVKKKGTAASRARRSRSSTTTRPTARSRSRCWRRTPRREGFELIKLPVTHPGVEQKATWLQIRQQRPDYVFLWGWGVMNSTAIKEAIAVSLPAPADVRRVVVRGRARRDARPRWRPRATTAWRSGTRTRTTARSTRTCSSTSTTRARAPRPSKEEVGQVLYNRGMLSAMLAGRIDPRRAGQVRQARGDRRGSALGRRAPEHRRRAHQGAGRRRHDAAAARPRASDHEGVALGPHPHLGRRPPGATRRTGSRPTTSSCGRWSRSTAQEYATEKKHHAARLLEGEAMLEAGALRRARVPRPAARGQRHRGDLQPRDPRAEGRVARRFPRGASSPSSGANGAGKTTTLKAISNLLHAERGEVTKGTIDFGGERVDRLNPSELVSAA